MLTIPEELLLLALDDDKGTVAFSAGSSLNYGLAGAALAELTIQERIDLKDNKIVVIDETLTGHNVNDAVLQQIMEAKKPKSVKRWVQSMNYRMGQWRKDMLRDLVDKGVLEEKEQKFLWVFSRNTYPTEREAPEQQIRQRIRTSLFGDEKPDARTAMLLSLIKACNLINEVFLTREKKDAKKRIDQISKNNDYGDAVKVSIDAMQTAVIAACAAAAASSGGDGGGGGA